MFKVFNVFNPFFVECVPLINTFIHELLDESINCSIDRLIDSSTSH